TFVAGPSAGAGSVESTGGSSVASFVDGGADVSSVPAVVSTATVGGGAVSAGRSASPPKIRNAPSPASTSAPPPAARAGTGRPGRGRPGRGSAGGVGAAVVEGGGGGV